MTVRPAAEHRVDAGVNAGVSADALRPGADQGPDGALLDALCTSTGGWLMTVVGTWGSAPCPPGALLFIDDQGQMQGSVSGGCVEEDLRARALNGDLPTTAPVLLHYGGDVAAGARVALPCGGRLTLICERSGARDHWQQVRAAVAAERIIARHLCVRTGKVTLEPRPRRADSGPDFAWDGQHARRLFGPTYGLILIGAGPITTCLAPIARALGYRILLCDPRAEQREAGAVTITASGCPVLAVPGMPDDCVQAHARHRRMAVVALTHDPRLDDLALMAALTSPAAYVGALGSRRTQAERRARLLALGLPAAAVARLRGPVGLDLGGKAPAEIAVAIAAELIAVRHGRGAVERE